MKILKIRFKNLNSIVGEWKIDFTEPAYSSSGIFAITGPTGSGKTTILDAICLALYGRTPRLNRVNASENEIMSRQTGECFSEVLFETSTGRYRCHWSQHRARKKAGAKLQTQKHEISDADTVNGADNGKGKVLSSTITEVANKVEELTGMNFDRFTRSMLLAQGDFAAFLQAEPEERSSILEQITKTEIYSEISIEVHKRYSGEKNRLELLEAEITDIKLLTQEQEEEIKDKLIENQNREKQLTKDIEDTNKALAWLKLIEELEKELAKLKEEESSLKEEIDEFQPERNRLNQANEVAQFDACYATFTEKRKQLKNDKDELEKVEKELPEMISTNEQLLVTVSDAEQKTKEAREKLNEALPIIRKAMVIDQEIRTVDEKIKEIKETLERHRREVEENRQTKLKYDNLNGKLYQKIEAIDKYIKEHKEDEWLVNNLAGVRVELRNLSAQQKSIEDIKNQITSRGKECEEKERIFLKRQGLCRELEKELKKWEKKIKEERAALQQLLKDKTLKDYRQEREKLYEQRMYLRQVASLEDHRNQLKDGVPCPLCGAKEHPFAQGNVPVPDEVEQKISELSNLIDEAEKGEENIRRYTEARGRSQNNYNDSVISKTTAENDKINAEARLEEIKRVLEDAGVDFDTLKERIIQSLEPLGIDSIQDTKVDEVIASLDARLQKWQDNVTKRGEIERKVVGNNSEIRRLAGIIENQNETLTHEEERFRIQKERLTEKKRERIELFGERVPKDEEELLTRKLEEAQTQERSVREKRIAHHQRLENTKNNIENMKRRIEERKFELNGLESQFLKAISPLGISDEKEYFERVLPIDERQKLARKAQKLDERRTDLQARQRQGKEQYEAELAKEVTDKTIDAIELKQKELETSLSEVRVAIAALNTQLTENNLRKKQLADQHAKIEAQRKECEKWGNLHKLIGSSDGKKYRNFAQGITFDVIIRYANNQMKQLSDRYVLIRDHASQLDLSVIDTYQADEMRSIKNLSGGESFLVSLSLALGLSQMVSDNIRVDSLFLDEGFGTLDDDSLSIALDALASYNQSGKIIGIISHVQAVKERISTQIEVVPQSGGKSKIVGVGVALSLEK